jgi:hypothetical protein
MKHSDSQSQRKIRLSKNFKRMMPIYRHFSREWTDLSYSDEMAMELFRYETYGQGSISRDNGYANGKKWMDVTVAMWLEDFNWTIFPHDLYEDENFPHWWLDKVLASCRKS